MPTAATGLHGAHLVHLAEAVVGVQPAGARGVVGRGREVARPEDAVISGIHLRELPDRLVLPAEGLFAPEGGQGGTSDLLADLRRGAWLRRAIGWPATEHDQHPEDVPAGSPERRREPRAQLLVVNDQLAVPEA